MEKRDRYKGKIGLLAVMRLGVVVLLLGFIGASVVRVKNRHVLKGNEIRKVELRSGALSQEIEMWELRIASVKDRNELKRRLRWVGSNMKGIEMDRVLRLQAIGRESSGLVIGIY